MLRDPLQIGYKVILMLSDESWGIFRGCVCQLMNDYFFRSSTCCTVMLWMRITSINRLFIYGWNLRSFSRALTNIERRNTPPYDRHDNPNASCMVEMLRTYSIVALYLLSLETNHIFIFTTRYLVFVGMETQQCIKASSHNWPIEIFLPMSTIQ